MSRHLLWRVMACFSVAIAAYALVLLAVPSIGAPFLPDRLATLPLALRTHLVASAVALAVGPFQFHARIRTTRPHLHRWLGRLYLLGVLAGGVSGLRLALVSEGGLVAHLGFGLLAACWLAATALAWAAVRRRDLAGHRAWMVRSYAMTFAAVSLRLYLPLGLMAGLPFGVIYPAVSWLCWVGNLLIAERVFVAPLRRRAA